MTLSGLQRLPCVWFCLPRYGRVADAWKRGPHFGNPVSVHAGCSDCHIPYEDEHPTPFQYVFGTLVTKGISGFTDVYQTIRGEISDKATWEAEKPRLTAQVHEFFKKTGSMTCKGCHTLDQFKGSASAEMAEKIHSTKKDDDHVVCITCHTEIAHVYADSAAKP